MRRKRVILVSCAVITICALLYHFTRPPDPVYEGRRLSEWLEDLDPPTTGSGNVLFSGLWNDDKPKHDQAVIAIQQIGTNALPLLKARMAERSGKWLDQLPDVLSRVIRSAFNDTDSWQQDRSRKYSCLFACYVLGPKAAELSSEIFEFEMDTGGMTVTSSVYPRLGSNAAPYLISMLSVTNESRHHLALYFLEEIGPQASAAIPDVLRILNDPLEARPENAAYTLVNITEKPAKTIAPLHKLLSGTNQKIHERIAEAMYAWNTTGRDIGPALLRLAQDTNSIARIPAAIALGKVAPDLATNVLLDLKQIALTNDSWHGYRAAESLVSMGELAKPVVDELLAQAMIPEKDRHCSIAKAVIAIDPVKGKILIPTLLEHFDQHPYKKIKALETLSLLGKSANTALPKIRLLLDDHSRAVRTAATNSLLAITSAPSAASTRATPP